MRHIFFALGILFMLVNGICADDREDLDFFQRLPKAELHLHLSGSYPKEYLFSIASVEEKEKLENILTQVRGRVDYHDAFYVFQCVHRIVNTEEKVAKGVEALCLALKEDGISYVEIRSGLKNLGSGAEAYINAILDGIKCQNSERFQATLLLSLQRNSSPSSVRETVDLALKYRERGIVGLDISGDSTVGQIDPILPELLRAKKEGLPFVIHIGESPKECEQIKLLSLLTPVRVGHGVFLSKEALDWVVSNRVPLEVCLTSSLLVQMIDQYDQHPGISLFKEGHPISFCTDDPLIFTTTLSQELLLAHKMGHLSKEEIKKIAEQSFQYKIGL